MQSSFDAKVVQTLLAMHVELVVKVCCTVRGPVSRYYGLVPPWLGLVSSVLFTIFPMS